MQQLNSRDAVLPAALACRTPYCPKRHQNLLAVLECRRAHLKAVDLSWEKQMNEYINGPGQCDVRRVQREAAIELSVQRLQLAEARENPHLYGLSVREQALAPNADTITTGVNEVHLDDSWFADSDGNDIRLLSGRDLRYWLLHRLNRNPAITFKISDLVESITNAGFHLSGRPSKTVSDALHTETDRGRITRTGWGRYALTQPLAPTSRKRITRRIDTLRNQLSNVLTRLGERIENLWRRELKANPKRKFDVIRIRDSLFGYHTNSTIRFFCKKVANPTAPSEKLAPEPAPQSLEDRLAYLETARKRVPY